MKRFYCTICKRVKRVRNLPSTIEAAIKPVDRTGVCNLHSSSWNEKIYREELNKQLKVK